MTLRTLAAYTVSFTVIAVVLAGIVGLGLSIFTGVAESLGVGA